MFVGVLLAMWCAAVNYENNLAYLVLSFVGSIGFLSMVHTYRNLADLEIQVNEVEPVFKDDPAVLKIRVSNRKVRSSYAIELKISSSTLPQQGSGLLQVPGLSDAVQELGLNTSQRGQHSISEIEISTLFPLGLFRASRTQPLQITYIVYPKPRNFGRWPQKKMGRSLVPTAPSEEGDDFYGFRAYRVGEPQHRIYWKGVARGQPLLVKEFSGGDGAETWLEWKDLADLEIEDKLSQLSFWIVQAHQKKSPFGLSLPQVRYEPDIGVGHFHQCLKALASFKL